MSRLKEDIELIVFDTETTGLDPAHDRVIQISAIKYKVSGEKLEEVARLNKFINPGFQISEQIEKLTGITNRKLLGSESEMVIFFKYIYKFFGERPRVAAYNSSFDIAFLERMYERYAKKFTPKEDIDVLALARDLIPKDYIFNFKLETVARYLRCNEEGRYHNSMVDTEATSRVYQKLMQMRASKEEAGEQMSFL